MKLTGLAAITALLSFASAVPWDRQPKIIDVAVGGPGILAYNPPYVHANNGDTIRFTFLEKNHTLTQSSFQAPCLKLGGGLDTGFVPNLNNIQPPNAPVRGLYVDWLNDKPGWFYCRQGNHCSQGMVFAVNPKSKEQFWEFVERSKGPYNGAPEGSPNFKPKNPSSTVSYTPGKTTHAWT